MKTRIRCMAPRLLLIFLILGLCLPSLPQGIAQQEAVSAKLPDGAEVVGTEPVTLPGGRKELTDEGYSLVYENDDMGLYTAWSGAHLGAFAVEDKAGDAVWYSSQPDSYMDEYAINMFELRAMLILECHNAEASTTAKYNSKAHSVDMGGLEILVLAKGLRFNYTFPEIGVIVPVSVIAGDDGTLTVHVNNADIREEGVDRIFDMQMLPYFMTGGEQDDGFLLVPDGSGAVMKFNNGKTAYSSYSQAVYGGDAGEISPSLSANNESIHMPVMGVRRNNAALFGVITQGAAQSRISATVSGVDSGYNAIWSTLQLRKVTTYSMDKGWQGSRTFYIYQESAPTLPALELTYYFLAGGDAGLEGMAKAYREHLAETGLPESGTAGQENTEPMVYVDFLGAVTRKKPVLGIPVDTTMEVTSFKRAQAITGELLDGGVENLTVRLLNWDSRSIDGKIVSKASPSSALGGKKGLASLAGYLEDHGVGFYPDVTLYEFAKTSFPFQQYADATRNMNNEVNKYFQYKRNVLTQDRSLKGWYTLAFHKLESTAASFDKSYAKLGIPSLSLGDMAGTQTSDYSRKSDPVELWEGEQTYRRLAADMAESYSLMLSSAFLPAAIYADVLVDLPQSSGYDMCDYGVPFYQMTVSGLIPYAGRAVNLSANTRAEFLYALATGSGLHYALAGDPAADNVKGTRYNTWIGTDSEAWLPVILEQTQEMNAVYAKLGGSRLLSYEVDASGVVVSGYEGGGELLINFSDKAREYDGLTLQPESYIVRRGGAVVE